MGCNASDGLGLSNTNKNFVQLMVSGRTQQLIKKIQEMGPLFKCNAPINFKGDTILHYACYRKNTQLIRYLKKKPDFLCAVRNKANQKPLDLANGDQQIKRLLA